MTPIRLTVVLTHPIQYYAPWFRYIASSAHDLALTVVYAVQPTPEQQGAGFDRPFTWDIPLTDGYHAQVVRPAKPGERIDASRFFGVDVREVGDAVLGTEPDVVLIGGWYSITLLRALGACRHRHIPVLYRGDSNLLAAPSGLRGLAWRLRTFVLLRQFDGYVSPGTRSDAYLRSFGAADHRIFKAPHAVDNAMFSASAAPFQAAEARAAARRAFGIDAEAFVPLFVGKLTESKRPLTLVRAAARARPATHLLIAGSGPLEAAVEAEAERLLVPTTMLGFLNQTELGRAYAIADCLVLPSNGAETWGLVVNEALSTGLPVIVSDCVGCAPDLVLENETGYVYPLDDVPALAERLGRVRDRTAMGHDWAASCRRVAEAHSFRAATAGLVRACRSVLRHSPGPEPEWTAAERRVLAPFGQMVIAGGLERMSFQVLGILRQEGALVHCIVNGWENYRITEVADEIGATWSIGPYWYPLTRRRVSPRVAARMILEVARVSLHLVREARRIRPTHVFLPDFQTVLRNAPALVWLRLRGVRAIARLGNAPEPGAFYRWLWRWGVAPFVETFVCISDFVVQELLAVGVHPDKVLRISNAPGRQHATASAAGGARIPGRIIFVGQIIPEKGLDGLLDAVAALRARGYGVTLDVVGDLEGWEAPRYRGYRAGVRARAAQADLAGAVNFLGWRDDVAALLARASVHCCPSRPEQREALGNVVLEAKIAGLPSVVGPSGALPSLIEHRVNGWACAESTPAALAEGLEFFLADPARLSAAQRASRASASAFSIEQFRDRWARVFAV